MSHKWIEGPFPSGLVVKENYFSKVGTTRDALCINAVVQDLNTESPHMPIQNLLIENNFFDKECGVPFMAGFCSDVIFKRNRIKLSKENRSINQKSLFRASGPTDIKMKSNRITR